MKINIVRILLCFSIGLTLLCSFLIYLSRQQKSEDLKWVLHSHDVIENVVSLQSMVQDAETGQRGYLLSHEEKYLLPYFHAVTQINEKVRHIRNLTSDNKIQLTNISLLEKEINRRLGLIDSALFLEKANRSVEAIRFVKNGKGFTSMNTIRSLFGKILHEENHLLSNRNKSLEKSILITSLVSYFSLFFIGCMSVTSLLVINKKQRINRNLIQNLNTYNENLESQIKQRTLDLEQINEKLVSLNDDKNQFLGMAAHDLKNPINTIKGLVNILQLTGDKNLTDEQKEMLDHVTRSTTKMSGLISDLLDVNKIDEGKTSLLIHSEDVLEIAEGVVYGFKETASKKGIGIFLRNQLENKILSTDKNALSRVLENLVSNSIKFSSKGKNVFVSLSNAPGKTIISIQDQGPGIKEEEKHLLFGKFQKLSNRPTEGESSTGLGLSIAKSLVEAMNGTIEYTSQVGKGTTFTLTFNT